MRLKGGFAPPVDHNESNTYFLSRNINPTLFKICKIISVVFTELHNR